MKPAASAITRLPTSQNGSLGRLPTSYGSPVSACVMRSVLVSPCQPEGEAKRQWLEGPGRLQYPSFVFRQYYEIIAQLGKCCERRCIFALAQVIQESFRYIFKPCVPIFGLRAVPRGEGEGILSRFLYADHIPHILWQGRGKFHSLSCDRMREGDPM